MYDVIVVGARVAGSSTAMLLARKGYRVLVVDRTALPSDTLSTHQVQLPGVAMLNRWGLLDRVIASGAPATRHVTFDQGVGVLEGHFPTFQGIDALYSPRRTVLDMILVEGAREAGAERREQLVVDELVTKAGRVIGIRGGEKGGAKVTETARLVVGADGKHSLAAKAVGGERVRAGRRVERFRSTPDLPNFFRQPYGPGWALVGDASLVMDPITGRGITDAFRGAELLAEAIDDGWSGRSPLDAALAGYQRQRDHEILPMYEFTTALASFGPPKLEDEVLLRSLVGRQAEIDRFLGVITGAVPLRDYLSPGNLLKVIGVRGMTKVMLSRPRHAPRPGTPQPEPV